MVYSLEQLKSIIVPIAQKHGIPAVFLFGSYARGTATQLAQQFSKQKKVQGEFVLIIDCFDAREDSDEDENL